MLSARLLIRSVPIYRCTPIDNLPEVLCIGENATVFAILSDSTKVGKYATSVSGMEWKRLYVVEI